MLNKRISVLAALLLVTIVITGILIWKKVHLSKTPLPYDEFFKRYTANVPAYTGPELIHGMDAELLWKANKGVHVFDPSGQFKFPSEVTRVWIDVGASMLETTREALFTQKDLAVIAIEPLEDCWAYWPKMDRLIAIPFAMHEVEGPQIFHKTKGHMWSSLVDQIPLAQNLYTDVREVVEEFEVEVYRLSRVLERIPEDVTIEVLKVDVQGVDYQVLKSAGAALRRAQTVKVEINLVHLYEGDLGSLEDPEKPFNDLMARHGFEVESRTVVEMGDRRNPEAAFQVYADVIYVNRHYGVPLSDSN